MQTKTIYESREKPIVYTLGQKSALWKIDLFLKSEDTFFLLAGYSGCGKTTLAENIARFAKADVLAPTNAAVNRLRDKMNGYRCNYTTIHSCLYSPPKKDGSFSKDKSFEYKKTYIIDEASMIDSYVLKDIIRDAKAKKAKIIFMGDSFQLEPVGEDPKLFEWEKSFPDDFFEYNRTELTEVKRYDGVLLKVATEIRTHKKPIIENPNSPELSFLNKFSSRLAKDINENGSYAVITSTNRERVKYNKSIREYRYKTKNLGPEIQENERLVALSTSNLYSNGEQFEALGFEKLSDFKTEIVSRGKKIELVGVLYAGKTKDANIKSYFLAFPYMEEPSLHGASLIQYITNGLVEYNTKYKDLLVIEFHTSNGIKKFFNRDVTICTFGYAISCHKSQGNEWDNVYINANWLMPVWDDARWFYTAITRAKENTEILNNKYLKVT